MGLINRGVKAGSGNRDFVGGSGKTILSSEVNTDFNTIFDEFNGNITNANIDAAAAIAGTKLNLTAHITDSMVNAAANIQGSKLLDGSIATAKLADASVTSAKISSGAACGDVVTASDDAAVTISQTGSGLSAWADIEAVAGDTTAGDLIVPAGDSMGVMCHLVLPLYFVNPAIYGDLANSLSQEQSELQVRIKAYEKDLAASTFSDYISAMPNMLVRFHQTFPSHVPDYVCHATIWIPSLSVGTYEFTPQWRLNNTLTGATTHTRTACLDRGGSGPLPIRRLTVQAIRR